MSEVTPTPEELIEDIEYEVEDAEVVESPIDPTLSIPGASADAKATGDAIAAVFTGAKINNKSFTNKSVTLYGSDIALTNVEGAQTLTEAINAIGQKTADGITYDAENLITVKGALDDIYDQLDTDLTTDEIDALFTEVFEGSGD